ncbi:MAG TPA: hypothetical protein V6D02_08030, partial [Candidatus Obscuribacterales bacterium]
MQQRSSWFAIAASCVVVLGLTVTGCSPATPEAQSYEGQLAQHLTAQGATMYGAFWCPHCADQKELFGEAVDDIQ